MLKIILYFYKAIIFLMPINYFYYKNGILINISLIIYLLNFLIIGYFINSFIFDNSIFCVKNDKIWIYSKNIKNVLSTKIIRNIIYNDNNFIIILENLKKNIYNIDNNIEVLFLLYFFNNIKINKKSYIKINFYNSKTKLINLNEKTKLRDFFI
jgi:hypothetical protein